MFCLYKIVVCFIILITPDLGLPLFRFRLRMKFYYFLFSNSSTSFLKFSQILCEKKMNLRVSCPLDLPMNPFHFKNGWKRKARIILSFCIGQLHWSWSWKSYNLWDQYVRVISYCIEVYLLNSVHGFLSLIILIILDGYQPILETWCYWDQCIHIYTNNFSIATL